MWCFSSWLHSNQSTRIDQTGKKIQFIDFFYVLTSRNKRSESFAAQATYLPQYIIRIPYPHGTMNEKKSTNVISSVWGIRDGFAPAESRGAWKTFSTRLARRDFGILVKKKKKRKPNEVNGNK